MLRQQAFNRIGRFYIKRRKIIIFILVIIIFWFFGLGVLGGWLLTKGGMESFPKIKSTDKILIVSPHIDDEILGSGGLIQQALKNNADIKVVYVTNGDDNLASVIPKDKIYNPNDFIDLGKKRMLEAQNATTILGLNFQNLIFLGYPDLGVNAMYSKNYNTPYVSPGTRLSYNPYQNTYQQQQNYTGLNLYSDLVSIIKNFQPTIIITTNPRDKNTDHQAVFLFIQKINNELNLDLPIYTFLIHYPLYPPTKRLKPNEFLYPPRTLFTKSGWYSFDLSTDQETLKLKAIDQNKTQMVIAKVDDLLESFVKENEIFEKMN